MSEKLKSWNFRWQSGMVRQVFSVLLEVIIQWF